MKIINVNEPLVQASMYPERILTRSCYHSEGLPGSFSEVWLRKSVFEALVNAAESLNENLRLVILDGWRSFELQSYLYNTLFERIKAQGFNDDEANERTSIYVAYPSKENHNVSAHLTGGAVDVTIAAVEGEYLVMGGEFDDTDEHSRTDYYDSYFRESDGTLRKITHEELSCRNRRTLFEAMTGAGFTNYEAEWWHYDYGDRNWAERTGFSGEVYGYIEPMFKWR